MDTKNYRKDIDGLRAVAVALVVFFHAFPALVPGGFVGVDVFFVISGYLITGILVSTMDRGTFSLGSFYARRIKRIFPALLFVLAFVLVMGWFMLFPPDYARLGAHVSGGAAFVANLQLWSESGYFDAAAETKPLLHLWSLGVEEQFYIFWPLLLFVLSKRKFLIFPVILSVGAISLIWSVYLTEADATAAFYSPISRIWELASGGMLAIASRRKPILLTGRLATMASLAGPALIVLAAVLLSSDGLFPGWAALLPVLGAVLVIAAGPQSLLNRYLLSRSWVVYVGLISYPLYLWHWPLLTFLRMHGEAEPSVSLRALVVLLSAMLAALTFHWVEQPIRTGSRVPVWKVSSAAGTCMVALFVAGLATYFSGGFPHRYSDRIERIASYEYDHETPYREHVCFLTKTETASRLGECSDGVDKGDHSTVLLWGDSYSAALYPGYKKALRGKARLLQVSTVGCPPAVGFAARRKRCTALAEEVMKRVREQSVGRVVMAARWSGHGWPRIAPGVARAIDALHKLGVKHIDIVGQLPEWRRPLPATLLEAYEKDGRIHRRMTFGWIGPRAKLESSLREFAAAHQARYLSPNKVMCNAEGCLTMVGDSDQLTTFDHGHLTAAASEFLVSRLEKQ